MIPNTKTHPPIVDADFDEAMRGLLAVKPPASGKKAKVAKKRSTSKKTTKTA